MILAIDFEYKNSNELKMDLIAVSYSLDNQEAVTIWLHNDLPAQIKLKRYLLELRAKNCKIMCFSASAEAHAFISLNLNPIKFDWIDLQCEWKMLTNHCDIFRYGSQLIDGKEVTTEKKEYWGKANPKLNHSLPNLSLLAATYKLLGIKEDLAHKNKMRDLILNSTTYSNEDREAILTYCQGDINNLFAMKDELMSIYKKLPTRHYSHGLLAKEIILRGNNSARSAVIESYGIPVNIDKVRCLANQVQNILDDCAKEIVDLFPHIKPFEYDKKNKRYKKNVKLIREFIKTTEYASKWETTETGELSLSLDSFTDLFSFRHEYPTDNFFAQMIRYLRLAQSFNGVKPKKGEATFFDSVGKDDRVRPYLNVYRAQSSRFQPKAKTFPFLWASWLRVIVEPIPSRIICGIDYASQEFLISALLSQDERMIEAYKSGDPYLYIGKQAKAIPEVGTKDSHKVERNIFKWVTLGISYAMTKVGLSRQLTTQLGKPFSEDEAEKLINLFFKVFPKYKIYTERIQKLYQVQKCLKLPDGWYMFGDNDNVRSVGNMPIQGTGAAILRKAIQLCQDRGLHVIFPLHDALYIELEKNDFDKIDLFFSCMKEAFTYYFEDKVSASLIRLEADAWGESLQDNNIITKENNLVTTKKIYIDGRGKLGYERFSKYLTNNTATK